MADEQAPVDETTPVAVPNQTPETEAPAPAVDTPTTPEVASEPDRGDPRVAMQEERRKRQELETLHNDPNWIYAQAQKFGMAAETDTPTVPAYAATPPAATPATPDIAQTVEHLLDFRETIKAHPELDPSRGDKGLVAWAAALVDRGHKPSEAADIIFKTMDKRVSQATTEKVQETISQQAAVETAKLNADTITSTASTTSEAVEREALEQQSKNWKDPRAQEAAILEKLKARMR